MSGKTPVSVLQELCIRENGSAPEYKSVLHPSDPKMFSFEVEAFNLSAQGSGRSKKEAKHEASANLIGMYIQQLHKDAFVNITDLQKSTK